MSDKKSFSSTVFDAIAKVIWYPEKRYRVGYVSKLVSIVFGIVALIILIVAYGLTR